MLGTAAVSSARTTDTPAEAEPFLELAQRTMGKDGVDVLSLIHRTRAAALLSSGSLSEPEDHARQAVAAIAGWDMPNETGGNLVQLADVLQSAGKREEAIAACSEALALYEQKENLVAAARFSGCMAPPALSC